MIHKKKAHNLKPSSYPILSKLNSLEAVLADLEEEEAHRRMEEAEGLLDALALKDPEEATRIFDRSPYFDEYREPYEIYLGQGVFVDKERLQELNTPEKRAAYIAACNE